MRERRRGCLFLEWRWCLCLSEIVMSRFDSTRLDRLKPAGNSNNLTLNSMTIQRNFLSLFGTYDNLDLTEIYLSWVMWDGFVLCWGNGGLFCVFFANSKMIGYFHKRIFSMFSSLPLLDPPPLLPTLQLDPFPSQFSTLFHLVPFLWEVPGLVFLPFEKSEKSISLENNRKIHSSTPTSSPFFRQFFRGGMIVFFGILKMEAIFSFPPKTVASNLSAFVFGQRRVLGRLFGKNWVFPFLFIFSSSF